MQLVWIKHLSMWVYCTCINDRPGWCTHTHTQYCVIFCCDSDGPEWRNGIAAGHTYSTQQEHVALAIIERLKGNVRRFEDVLEAIVLSSAHICHCFGCRLHSMLQQEVKVCHTHIIIVARNNNNHFRMLSRRRYYPSCLLGALLCCAWFLIGCISGLEYISILISSMHMN